MKIVDVRTFLLTSQWVDHPFLPVELHSTALVQVLTDKGVSGLGETIIGYFAPELVPPLVGFYKPLLLDEDPEKITTLWEKLYNSSIYWGRTGAAMSVISAIEMALWDLKAKAAGVPLYQLLGGLARESLPLYYSGGPSLWPVQKTVEMCQYYIHRGYRAFKFSTGYYMKEGPSEIPSGWKIKRVPKARLGDYEGEKLEAVRRAVGPEIDIIIDGHQGGIANPYSVADALRVAESIAPYGILFFEEPLPYTDPHGYAELRRHAKVPIGGGESLSGIYEFRHFLQLGALDVVQPEVTFVGGISTCYDVLKQAASQNLRSALHCGGTFGPGLAASIHISFASSTSLILEHVVSNMDVQNDIMLEPVVLQHGAISPPSAPGLGVQINDELLAKYAYIPGSGEIPPL